MEKKYYVLYWNLPDMSCSLDRDSFLEELASPDVRLIVNNEYMAVLLYDDSCNPPIRTNEL